MFKVFFMTVIALVFSLNTQAQEAELEETTTVTVQNYDAEIDKIASDLHGAVNKVGEVVRDDVPVMVDNLAEMMKEMLRIMAPTMIAIEEGKKLPAATEEMANEVKNSISHKYTSKLTYDINNEVNELKVNGEYEENNTILKYEINRNLAQSVLIQDMLDGTAKAGLLGEEGEIEDLNGNDIPITDFENFDINGISFVGYENPDAKTIYLLTNVGAYITMRIQVSGDNYMQVGGDFVNSFDYTALKTAVDDDGRSIEEIKSLIDRELSDPVKLQELMTQTSSKI